LQSLSVRQLAAVASRQGCPAAAAPQEQSGPWDNQIAAMIRKAGGRGRSPELLRKDIERANKEWQAAHHANTQPQSRDRMLTEEDRQVIETALLDLLSYKGSDLAFLGDEMSPDIILVNQTAQGPGLIMDSQMNSELDAKQASDVSLEIREHLSQRNGEPTSLAAFKSANQHILLESLDAVRSRSGVLGKRAPWARACVQVFLPGYSKSHDRAALRFSLGPSPHGAAGTCFLLKSGGVWQVSWRHFAFFV
jgi:hypothetical protein